MSSIPSLAERYIASHKLVWGKEMVLHQGDTSDAAVELYELCRVDSATAWSVICAICRIDQTDDVLQILANGPLIEFLRRGSEAALSQVRATASHDQFVRLLFSHVWEDSGLPEPVFAEICALSEPS